MDDETIKDISRDVSDIKVAIGRLEANQLSTSEIFSSIVGTTSSNQNDIAQMKVHLKYLSLFFGILLTGVVSFFYTSVAKS